MKTHPKTALAAMILVLVVATAATAFAGDRKRLQQHTAAQVARMVNQGSLSMLRTKMRAAQAMRGNRIVRVAFAVPR